MKDLKEVTKIVKKVVEKVKELPPLCQNCKKGTLSGEGDTLSCTFCKNPKE